MSRPQTRLRSNLQISKRNGFDFFMPRQNPRRRKPFANAVRSQNRAIERGAHRYRNRFYFLLRKIRLWS